MQLTLPYPPSVNRYWRHPTSGKLAGRHLISAEGRSYRESVALLCSREARVPFEASQRLSVAILARPPDRRQRDLDNLPKAVLDALTHSGLWPDDSQIDRLLIERGEVVKDGLLVVTIEEIRHD